VVRRGELEDVEVKQVGVEAGVEPRSVSMTAMDLPRAAAHVRAVYVFPDPGGPERATRARA
jgi:hypothetical protein